jgi:hypothetical protein
MKTLVAGTICALGLALASGGCAHTENIPGTTVPNTEANQAIIRTVEEYRTRLEERDVEHLLLLASERYFEDAGTPRADDDYGYEQLKEILAKRLSRVRSLRYQIQYRNVRMLDRDKAEVEVYLNGAFELLAEGGERYRRISDFHRFILEREGERWKFLSGM